MINCAQDSGRLFLPGPDTNDHWNKAERRQSTGNTGRSSGIELIPVSEPLVLSQKNQYERQQERILKKGRCPGSTFYGRAETR